MAICRVSYKSCRPFAPNADDLNMARNNLQGVDSYIAQLKYLNVTGEVMDDILAERVGAEQYVIDILEAIEGNGGGGRI